MLFSKVAVETLLCIFCIDAVKLTIPICYDTIQRNNDVNVPFQSDILLHFDDVDSSNACLYTLTAFG